MRPRFSDLRGYFPRKGGICSFLAALYRGIVLRDSGLERCMNASDDELYPNGEQEEPENAIDDFELFFSDASCNDVGVTHRVIDHVISSPSRTEGRRLRFEAPRALFQKAGGSSNPLWRTPAE